MAASTVIGPLPCFSVPDTEAMIDLIKHGFQEFAEAFDSGQIAVSDNDLFAAAKTQRQFFDDVNGTMLSAGAADGDGERRAIVAHK